MYSKDHIMIRIINVFFLFIDICVLFFLCFVQTIIIAITVYYFHWKFGKISRNRSFVICLIDTKYRYLKKKLLSSFLRPFHFIINLLTFWTTLLWVFNLQLSDQQYTWLKTEKKLKTSGLDSYLLGDVKIGIKFF